MKFAKGKSIAFVVIVFLIGPDSLMTAQDRYGSLLHRLDSLESEFRMPSESAHQRRIDGSFVAGTVFMSYPEIMPFTTLYAAPGISYQMTPGLELHGGIMAVSTSVFPFAEELRFREPHASVNLSMYLAASYRLNDYVMLHGSGTRHIYTGPRSSLMRSRSFDDISLGASFTIGNITIGASIHSRTNPLLPGRGPAGIPTSVLYPSFW